MINSGDNIIDRIAISVTPAIRLHFDFCSSIALRKPPSSTSRLPSNRREMYTSAKQIPDYRWPRITFTYSIHLPLHTGGYRILPRSGGAASDTSCRKRVEGEEEGAGTGRIRRIARSPSGRATDDDKNGGIFIATVNAVSCLPSCLRRAYIMVFSIIVRACIFLKFRPTKDNRAIDNKWRAIRRNRVFTVKIILEFPISTAETWLSITTFCRWDRVIST